MSHVQDLNSTFIRGLEAGDASAVAGVYAADGKLLAPNMEPLEGSAIEQFWAAAIGQGIRGATLRTETVDERVDLAVEFGRYSLLTEPQGGEVMDDGKYIVVHRRQPDGSWLYGLDMFSSSRPAQ
jgi:uncharacterized protein (TIGR02246 family)